MISPAERSSINAELFDKQRADGAWPASALGPWSPHPNAPPAPDADGYATAFASFVLVTAGTPPADPHIARALSWLAGHQSSETGAWPAQSMNKRYPEGSMEASFMQDAATAFASLALIKAGNSGTR